jgi:hypothetical protein
MSCEAQYQLQKRYSIFLTSIFQNNSVSMDNKEQRQHDSKVAVSELRIAIKKTQTRY